MAIEPRNAAAGSIKEVSRPGGQTRPIRVVRVIDRLNIGGPAKHVVWLGTGLKALGYESILVCGSVAEGEGDMSYFAAAAGIEPIRIKRLSRSLGPGDVLVTFALLRLFWNVRPDIIHTHKAKAGAVGRVAAFIYKWMTPSALWLKPRRCRVVHTYHGHVFHSYFGKVGTFLTLVIERTLAWLCTDRIIVISNQQRDEICRTFHVGQESQYRVIPLGIDLNEIGMGRGTLRGEYGVSDDECLIGAVGRLCEVKNYSMLLQAVAILHAPEKSSRPFPRVKLAIVGDGHLRESLESQARELGISDRVIFTGFRENATELYGEFDLVALTSLNEGTPLTLIEGMARGRAVVATEVGGVVDLMGAKQRESDSFSVWQHGLTVTSRDVDSLARALAFAISDSDLRKRMGARARAFVYGNLSTKRLVDDVDRLYHELTSRDVASREAARAIAR